MVGLTGKGLILVVPIEPTGQHGVWRAVSAFMANTHDVASYGKEVTDE